MLVRTIQDLLPAFAVELESLTLSVGRGDLVTQIRSLPVLERCTCGERNCAHFYTEPRPLGPYGAGHTNLMLPTDRGLIVYDLVDDRIVAVEVLDRPEVTAVLDGYFVAG
jgi:hypothetical protein